MADKPTIKDTEAVKAFLTARKVLIKQLVREQRNGVNRMICVIREHGREWDKDHAGDETYIQGGFVQAIKHELEEEDFPIEFKGALRYL